MTVTSGIECLTITGIILHHQGAGGIRYTHLKWNVKLLSEQERNNFETRSSAVQPNIAVGTGAVHKQGLEINFEQLIF